MKYLVITLVSVLLGAASVFAQTGNKQKDSAALSEPAEQNVCSDQNLARLNDQIKAQPKSPELYLQRAGCLRERNNPDFLKDVVSVINLNPKLDFKLYKNLKNLVSSKQPEESRANLDYLTGALPAHWFPYAVRLLFRMDQKEFHGAVDDWVKVFELTPLLGSYQFRQSTFMLEMYTKNADTVVFYDRLYNAAQKRHEKLSAKLKEFPYESEEFKEVRSNLADLGSFTMIMCLNWAKLAVQRLKDPQMESAALEKMVALELRWQGYELRSAYYQTTGKPEKAFADQVRSHETLIELLNSEIKQARTQAQQLYLNNQIADQYSIIGDLYVRNQEYAKAISYYEKAKPFSRYQTAVEAKINAARQKLNVTEEKPRANDQLNPPQKSPQTSNPNPAVKP